MSIGNEYVAIALHVCPVCGEKHSHNTEVLLHRNLKNISEQDRFTGEVSLCKEHDELFKQGYIACVVTSLKEGDSSEEVLGLYDTPRTGEVIHVRSEAFADIFDVDIGDTHMTYITPEVGELLKGLQEKAPVH